MNNKDIDYLSVNYPELCSSLDDVSDVVADVSLAFIAGDYSDMSDDEVIATFINENLIK